MFSKKFRINTINIFNYAKEAVSLHLRVEKRNIKPNFHDAEDFKENDKNRLDDLAFYFDFNDTDICMDLFKFTNFNKTDNKHKSKEYENYFLTMDEEMFDPQHVISDDYAEANLLVGLADLDDEIADEIDKLEQLSKELREKWENSVRLGLFSFKGKSEIAHMEDDFFDKSFYVGYLYLKKHFKELIEWRIERFELGIEGNQETIAKLKDEIHATALTARVHRSDIKYRIKALNNCIDSTRKDLKRWNGLLATFDANDKEIEAYKQRERLSK